LLRSLNPNDLQVKSFRNKDLAPKRALKRLWGSFQGRLGGRTLKLPQSDFYFRARRALSQFIFGHECCGEKVRRQMGGSAILAASSQGEDRWRAAQEPTPESAVWQATLRLGLRAGFLEKREKWRIPTCFAQCQKNKPAFYFAVKVAHPPGVLETR
jgi:hypothetical protein